jgi:hypothetical protein
VVAVVTGVLDEAAIGRLVDAVIAPGNVARYAASHGLTTDEATGVIGNRVSALTYGGVHPFAYGDVARLLAAMLIPQVA